MENKVGDHVPKQKKLDELVAKFASAANELKAFCITIDDEERKQLLHPRRGGEAMVEKAADLCARYKITVKAAPIEGMLNDLRLSKQLRPFVATLEGALKLAKDTEAQAESEYWQAFLTVYAVLAREASHDPALEAEVKEIADFMSAYAYKRKTPPAEKADPSPKNEPPKG